MNASPAKKSLPFIGAVVAIVIVPGFFPWALTRANFASNTIKKERPMTIHAHGTFEVKITPQKPEDTEDGVSLGRCLNEKQFHGDIQATSRAEMLTAVTPVKGSAGYVALERVTGTLKGRSGSFVLQHSGIMDRGVPQLSVTVVPDSGTGELVGLAGKMAIDIRDGKHFYDLDYMLPDNR